MTITHPAGLEGQELSSMPSPRRPAKPDFLAPIPRRLRSPPCRRRDAEPGAEGAGEGALLGVAEQQGDVEGGERRVAQVDLGQLAAGGVEHLLEGKVGRRTSVP